MDDRVIPQESINPGLGAMMARRHSQLAAWNYLKSHWAEAIERGGMGFGNLVESTGQLPAALRQDLVAFMDANLQDLAPMSYARALEIMDQRAEFKSRTQQDLLAWFTRDPH
jgi:hypothetical protein